jgi:hypothetical protein
MQEEWRETIKPGYEVSNHGRVRSYVRPGGTVRLDLGPRLLTPAAVMRNGVPYYHVMLGRGCSQLVHSLVAKAFIGPRPPGQHVRHADHNGLNNRLDNLSYGTGKENAEDSQKVGRLMRGESHVQCKLSDVDVATIRARRGAGERCKDIALDYPQIHPMYVSDLTKPSGGKRLYQTAQ